MSGRHAVDLTIAADGTNLFSGRDWPLCHHITHRDKDGRGGCAGKISRRDDEVCTDGDRQAAAQCRRALNIRRWCSTTNRIDCTERMHNDAIVLMR